MADKAIAGRGGAGKGTPHGAAESAQAAKGSPEMKGSAEIRHVGIGAAEAPGTGRKKRAIRLDVRKVRDDVNLHLQKVRSDLQKIGKVDLKRQIELSRRTLRVEKNLVIIILVLSMLGLVAFFVGNSFASPQDAAAKFRSLGALGPLLVIFLVILEIVFTPIPGTLIAIASGFAFGTFWGALWVYIGAVIGCSLAFFIARRFGRPFVERIVSRDKLVPYDEFFRRRGILILWITIALPIFPSDVLSYVAGLSSLTFRRFFPILIIASVPNVVIMTYLGATLARTGFSDVTVFIGGFLVFTFIVGSITYLYLRKKMGRVEEGVRG